MFKTKDRNYLVVLEIGGKHRVAWYIEARAQKPHALLGSMKWKHEPTDEAQLVRWYADQVAMPLAYNKDKDGFDFETEEGAEAARRSIDDALQQKFGDNG